VKVLVFLSALGPAAYLFLAAAMNELGPNPAEALIRASGDWTLRFLCLTLAVTPLRRITGLDVLQRYRRMLGLFTFFYAVLHVLAYAAFDMGFVVADIVRDIARRPFILVGFSALVLLLPLAATSNNRAIRLLGALRWRRLHRLVYGVAALALLHFWWMRAGKNDFAEPVVYIIIVLLLLGMRLDGVLAPAKKYNKNNEL